MRIAGHKAQVALRRRIHGCWVFNRAGIGLAEPGRGGLGMQREWGESAPRGGKTLAGGPAAQRWRRPPQPWSWRRLEAIRLLSMPASTHQGEGRRMECRFCFRGPAQKPLPRSTGLQRVKHKRRWTL